MTQPQTSWVNRRGDAFKRGDRVIISRNLGIKPLTSRKGNSTGRVTSVNGGYVYVRPSWCKWVIELYAEELKLA